MFKEYERRFFSRTDRGRVFILFWAMAAVLSLNGCVSVPQVGPSFCYYLARQKRLPDADSFSQRMARDDAMQGEHLVGGNRVSLLLNRPAAYKAMFHAINIAKKEIDIETFILSSDRAGEAFADILRQKAAQGVRVNLIYDSIGSFCSSKTYFQSLKNAGIKVLAFNPVTPLSGLPLRGRWSLDHRDHRKLAVVDGSTAFVGSANISNVCGTTAGMFLGTTGEQLPWRDTDIEIKGPVVAKFRELFFATWRRQQGPPIGEKFSIPPPQPVGNALVMAVGSTWGAKNRDNYFAYLAAIDAARHSIDLTCAYLIPDKHTLEALTAAARRGVAIRIIVPHKSDSAPALYGARAFYARLLRAGIKLYERKGVILHAKTAVIDGVWSTV
ncbi:MAG: phospholipase D-like domain-containing protein, partial [Syntrophobacteraceae bacterium]